MIRRLLTTLVLAAMPLASGCMQRTNADLPVQGAREDFAVNWELVGTFGEPAPSLPEGADAWQASYPPGQFREIAGVCATDREVWVCDLGVSRVQVFDFTGRFLREVGRGVPLDGLLPSDELLYKQQQLGKKKMGDWQVEHGQPWIGSEGELFKAADVCVTTEGFWLADQARTDVGTAAKRGAGYYVVTPGGVLASKQSRSMDWPAFIAVAGPQVACADTLGNFLWLAIPGGDPWNTKEITNTTNFNGIMLAQLVYKGTTRLRTQLMLANGASTAPGKFNNLGGVVFAFNKLVACDSGNRRLEVFEARPGLAGQWGGLVRVIPNQHPKLGQRFDVPLDIDIAPDGLVFVLDVGRREVALLNPRFERIGSFGLGEITGPQAIDLSDDGKHCFITDNEQNKVFHYAVRD